MTKTKIVNCFGDKIEAELVGSTVIDTLKEKWSLYKAVSRFNSIVFYDYFIDIRADLYDITWKTNNFEGFLEVVKDWALIHGLNGLIRVNVKRDGDKYTRYKCIGIYDTKNNEIRYSGRFDI